MNVLGNRAGRVVGILVSAIFAFFALAGAASAAGEYEPNDNRGAPAGPIAPGSTISATLESTSDSDWYVYYVAEETEVRFTVTKTGGPDVEMGAEMVYANGDNVTFKRLDTGTSAAELVATVPPGKYFAWIYGSPEFDNTDQTYSVSFTKGLSTLQAIQSGCTSAQGRVTTNTASINAANAELAKANTALAKAKAKLSKAKKALARAMKKKAGTQRAKKARAKAIRKARQAVKGSNGSVSKTKSGVATAQSKQAAVQVELDKAKTDAERLCGIEA